MSDLTERLRKRQEFVSMDGAHWFLTPGPDEDCTEAADALDAKDAEIERLREQINQICLDDEKDSVRLQREKMEQYTKRLEVQSRLAMLEAAARAIIRIPTKPFPDPGAHSWEAWGRAVHRAYVEIQHIAVTAIETRAALSTESEVMPAAVRIVQKRADSARGDDELEVLEGDAPGPSTLAATSTDVFKAAHPRGESDPSVRPDCASADVRTSASVSRRGEPSPGAEQWRPIETAPRDVSVIVWDGTDVGEASRPDATGRWWWANTDDDWAEIFPIRWRPLPAPPADASEVRS